MKHYIIGLEDRTTIGLNMYVVKVTIKGLLIKHVYYLSKDEPSNCNLYYTYELCTPDRIAHATIVRNKNEAIELWNDFVNNTDLIIKHKKDKVKSVKPKTISIMSTNDKELKEGN